MNRPHFNLPPRIYAVAHRLNLLWALLVGLLPPLAALGVITVWYHLPLDATVSFWPLTPVVLLLSPFAGGFAYCRRRAQADLTDGALPAFWLWAAGVAEWIAVLGLPEWQNCLISLVSALIAGITGGMSAQRIAKIHEKQAAAENSA